VQTVDREKFDDIRDRLRMRDGIAVEQRPARREHAVEVRFNAVTSLPGGPVEA
jgi:hypothetical protein